MIQKYAYLKVKDLLWRMEDDIARSFHRNAIPFIVKFADGSLDFYRTMVIPPHRPDVGHFYLGHSTFVVRKCDEEFATMLIKLLGFNISNEHPLSSDS